MEVFAWGRPINPAFGVSVCLIALAIKTLRDPLNSLFRSFGSAEVVRSFVQFVSVLKFPLVTSTVRTVTCLSVEKCKRTSERLCRNLWRNPTNDCVRTIDTQLIKKTGTIVSDDRIVKMSASAASRRRLNPTILARYNNGQLTKPSQQVVIFRCIFLLQLKIFVKNISFNWRQNYREIFMKILYCINIII